VVEATLTELLSMVPGAVRGEVPASDHYRVWSCSHVDVSSSEPMDVSVDGELRSGSHFRYEVIRGGLRVFRP
jgi:diacylglycerol kinase family enzyme